MTGATRSLLVATAGHVDHGKSTIVRHLTGVDPDRLAEERRRGLTIDLGFAVATLPSGSEVSFVDVPGHARYLSTMVAGVGAVSACLLVVSAVEGWRAQTEEHLRIVDLLGVPAGVVVVTRSAQVDAARRAEVDTDVRARLEGSALAGAPVVAVDLVSGVGHDALVAVFEDLVDTAPAAPDRGRPRLWVDRAFTVSGAGTIVTGSLEGGGLAVGTRIEVRSGVTAVPARIRRLEVHGRAVEQVGPGTRVAANLAGVDRDAVGRGCVLVEPGRWHPTTTADVAMSLFATAAPVRSGRGALLVTTGTLEQPVRVLALQGDVLAPGATTPARLTWSSPVPLLPGDRLVLRDTGTARTIGGGVVLDVDPVLPRRRARPDDDPARVVRERGWITPEALERRTGVTVPPTVPGWIGAPEAVAADHERLAEAMVAAGSLGLALDALSPRDRAVVAALEDVQVTGGRGHRAARGLEATSGYLAALRAAPFRPPAPAEHGCPPEELRALRAAGLVRGREGVWFATDAVATAASRVGALLVTHAEGITVAQVRDVLDSSRRWVLPLLALLDDEGVTRRVGELRRAGPSAPPAASE